MVFSPSPQGLFYIFYNFYNTWSPEGWLRAAQPRFSLTFPGLNLDSLLQTSLWQLCHLLGIVSAMWAAGSCVSPNFLNVQLLFGSTATQTGKREKWLITTNNSAWPSAIMTWQNLGGKSIKKNSSHTALSLMIFEVPLQKIEILVFLKKGSKHSLW